MKERLKRAAKVLVDELVRSDDMVNDAVEFYGHVMCMMVAKRKEEKARSEAKFARLFHKPRSGFRTGKPLTKGKK